MGLLNISFSPEHYIFLEITFPPTQLSILRGLPDLTFRWYKITDEQEGLLLRIMYNAFIHRRNGYACSTKWDLRTGDRLALLAGGRSAAAWGSAPPGLADCQPP